MGRLSYMQRRVESLEKMLARQRAEVAYYAAFEDTPMSMSVAEGLRVLYARAHGRLTWSPDEVRAWVASLSDEEIADLRGFGPKRVAIVRAWAEAT